MKIKPLGVSLNPTQKYSSHDGKTSECSLFRMHLRLSLIYKLELARKESVLEFSHASLEILLSFDSNPYP